MTDVFISYSRKDKTFIQQLHQSLAAVNRDVWVDWEDIPVTADWWREICEGIQNANAFVFVISPDSAQSRVCRDEVQYAVQLNKRIIPVLRHELVAEDDKQQLHHSIHSHNWLFFREQDDYDNAFKTLLTALDTDLEHVRRHTRLLGRAQEWLGKNRDPSFLLIGTDYSDAESWLETATSKEPLPTVLQAEYIAASRRAAQRRQRTLMLSIGAVAVVILGLLGLFGITQFATAQRLDSAYKTAVAAVATTEGFLPFTIVEVDWLNLYANPDLNLPVLIRVNRGERLRVLGRTQDNQWFLARTDRGAEGFVNADATGGLQRIAVDVPIIDTRNYIPLPPLP